MNKRKFEAIKKNVKILNYHPFKLRYKGHRINEVSEKYRRLGSIIRVIGNKCFVEAGRMKR